MLLLTPRLAPAIVCVILFVATTAEVAQSPLPDSWKEFCTLKTDSNILGSYVNDGTPRKPVDHMQCHVTEMAGSLWRFQTLQDQLRHIVDTVLFVEVKCSSGGKLSLPWPMKANSLIGLVVSGCILTDKYAKFLRQDDFQISDQLRVLEIRNSVWLTDWSEFNNITTSVDLSSLDSDYDCGHDHSIEYLVISNMSVSFTNTPDEFLMDSKTQTQTSDSSPENNNPGPKTIDQSMGNRPAHTNIDQSSMINNPVQPIGSAAKKHSAPMYTTDKSLVDNRPSYPVVDRSLLNNKLPFLEKYNTLPNKLPNPRVEKSDIKPSDNEFGGNNSNTNTKYIDLNTKNNGVDFIRPDISNIKNVTVYNNTDDSVDDFKSLFEKLLSLDIKCRFEKLKLMDESYSQFLPIKHFELMVHSASYPELRVMNYSSSGIRELPEELQNFRENFPKLERLDLSGNYMRKIRLYKTSNTSRGLELHLDVTANRITDVSIEDVIEWSTIEDVFVDIRDNPIQCGCHMLDLVRKIRSDTFRVGRLLKYKYINNLKCFSPDVFKGYNLSQIVDVCAKDSTPPTTKKLPIIITVSVFSVIVVIVVLVVVAWKCCRQKTVTNSNCYFSSDAKSELHIENGFSEASTKEKCNINQH